MGLQARVDIAAALSSVAGVNGHPRKPAPARAGDGWPMKPSGEAVVHGVFEISWQVAIMLPTDEAAGEDWIVDHLDSLCEALAPTVWVAGWETGTSGDSPVLILLCKEG